MALQLYAIANRERYPAIGKLIDRFIGADQCPLSTGFRDASLNNSVIVQDQERDPESGNRPDSSDGAHHQTLVNRPHSETLLTRVDICRSSRK